MTIVEQEKLEEKVAKIRKRKRKTPEEKKALLEAAIKNIALQEDRRVKATANKIVDLLGQLIERSAGRPWHKALNDTRNAMTNVAAQIKVDPVQ